MNASVKKLSPSLFDLPQDIVKDLPIDIVDRWAKSEQTPQAALEILEVRKVRGTSVSSDSAGLTRISQSKGLVEILSLINRPKELIHAYGTAIGGISVGIWAADNTQMFYPESVSAHDITAMLLGVQERITKECEIRVGIGAHFGEFYDIGGGFYGPDADIIEEVAENETAGGEVVISKAVHDRLPEQHGFIFHPRPDLVQPDFRAVRVTDGPRWHLEGQHNHAYPIPYSQDFYNDLRSGIHPIELEQKYSKEKVVVLVERSRSESNSSYAALLDDLASSVLMRKLSLPLLHAGKEIKIAGNLGIFVFDDVESAMKFAQEFRSALHEQEIESRIGIEKGSVLLFDLPGGGHDIAGNPVNIASKMAQDQGTFGNIYITKSAVQTTPEGFSPITFTVSGVQIEAFEG